MQLVRRCLVTGLLLLPCGCSFLLVHGPPSPPIEADAPAECTRSVAAPVVDAVLGLAAFGVGALMLNDAQSCRPPQWCIGTAAETGSGAALFGIGAVALASSVYGGVKTSRCHDVVAWQGQCASGDREACDALAHGPPPGAAARAEQVLRGGSRP